MKGILGSTYSSVNNAARFVLLKVYLMIRYTNVITDKSSHRLAGNEVQYARLKLYDFGSGECAQWDCQATGQLARNRPARPPYVSTSLKSDTPVRASEREVKRTACKTNCRNFTKNGVIHKHSYISRLHYVFK